MLSVTEYLANGTSVLPAFQELIFILAALLGLFTTGMGLFKLLSVGEPGNQGGGLGSAMSLIICGALLVSLYGTSDVIAGSIFGADADTYVVRNIVKAPEEGRMDSKTFITILFYYLVVIGWLAVLNGILTFAHGPGNGRAYGQDGYVRKGAIYLISGVLLVNFVPLSNAIGTTLAGKSAGTIYFSVDK